MFKSFPLLGCLKLELLHNQEPLHSLIHGKTLTEIFSHLSMHIEDYVLSISWLENNIITIVTIIIHDLVVCTWGMFITLLSTVIFVIPLAAMKVFCLKSFILDVILCVCPCMHMLLQ